MRFLRRSLVGVLLLAVTLVVITWSASLVREAVMVRLNEEPRVQPQREREFAANVVLLEPATLTPELTVFGELRSRRTLALRSGTGGIVLEVSEDLVEGGVVEQGQILVRIDPAEAEAELNRTQADLQDAEAEVRDAERALALAQDDLVAAQGQYTLQQQALTRARDLETRGVGTTAAVETAELAVSSAQASVLSSRQSAITAEARIDQARTGLDRAKIAVAEAERIVADTVVRAAFDGILSEVTVSLGGRLTANEQFAQLIDPGQLEVAFRVSTSQYARLLDGNGTLLNAPVRVALDVSGVNLHADGQIIREGATVGTGQTGRLLFARLDSAAGFRSGDFVTVGIDEPEVDGVSLVPSTAVAADQTVLVVDDENRLQLASVELLRRQGDNVIIRIGDLVGQTIVAERSPLLGAGIKVQPIRPGEAAVEEPDEPEMIVLDEERRTKLLEYVTGSRMPEEVKQRIIGQLEQEEVSSETVTRLESRMGS